MRIAFIGQKGIPAKLGGIEKHVEELSIRLAQMGNEVFVYTRPHYTPKNLKEFRSVKLISLPSIPSKHLDAISHTFLACFNIIFRKVDIVHFQSIGPSSLIWLVKLFRPNVKVIATFHTHCYTHKKWGKFAQSYLKISEKLMVIFADKIISISKLLEKYTKDRYNKNSLYIPNGVGSPINLEANMIKTNWELSKESYFLIVSRLIPHKGIKYAIEAFMNLKTEKKLVIVGSGFHTSKYESYLKKLGKEDKRIIFTGTQSGLVLSELFSNALAFIQPSELEGLSIALLEAMSYGLPIIISDIPENLEVIKENGFSFKNKNTQDLKIKLAYLLNNYSEAKQKGIKAQKDVIENYNWEIISKETNNLYKKALMEKNTKYFSINNLTKKNKFIL